MYIFNNSFPVSKVNNKTKININNNINKWGKTVKTFAKSAN